MTVKKILLCCESFDPSSGGPAYSVRRLGYCLAHFGAEVGFWTFDGSGDRFNADIEANGCRHFVGDFEEALNAFGMPEIVHDNSIWRSQNHKIAVACEKRGIRRVVSARGMLEPWAMAHKKFRKKLAWYAFQKRDLNRADLIHATAGSEAVNISALGLRPNICIMPNGVDFPEIALHSVSMPRTALFLSRIHPQKGIDLLLSAWRRLRPLGWHLRIVGPGERKHVAVVKAQIKRHGLEGDVTLEKALYETEKVRAFSGADLFILPSFSENFGIVVAEALSYGLPVITTTGTPWQALAEERCGWWVAPEEASISEALKEATACPAAELRAMGQRGRDLVEKKFSWVSIGHDFLRLYGSVLGK